MNNQEILRKHTALTISRKDVNTSFILFPVRLETRFVEGHGIEDISEPDRALYAFKAIWNYVCALSSKSDLLDKAKRVLVAVEDLDTVYREDKTRLIKIAGAIATRTSGNPEVKAVWDKVLVHLDRLATLDIVNDNEATDFLRQLDKVDRIIKELLIKPRYCGTTRIAKNSTYSQTAVFKYARKQMQECFPILEQFLPQDPSRSIVNRFTYITKNQFKKYQRVIDFLHYGQDALSRSIQEATAKLALRKRSADLREQMRQGLYRDFRKYEEYRARYFGLLWNGFQYKSRVQSLTDKMRSKIGEYSHYTRFAERMILWKLWLDTGNRKDIASMFLVEKWRELAKHTIFSFHEEREWLVSVLKVFNDYEYQKCGTVDSRISPAHLNRHNRYIRPRKLSYRVPAKKCLLVRIYPDEVAVTQLSRPISTAEVTDARTFWMRYFAAREDATKMKAAWDSLCSMYAPPRAALIARTVFPNSSGQVRELKSLCERYADQIYHSSAKTLEEELPVDVVAKLKSFFAPVQGTDQSAEELFPVPMSDLMPDRFVLQATMDNGGKDDVTVVRYGHLIPKTIQVGLDFNDQDYVENAFTGLRFKGNLRWMTDYGAAERMGMAITLPLDGFYYDHYVKSEKNWAKKQNRKLGLKTRVFHFHSIYVMGIKEFDTDNKADSLACSNLLAKVFNAHLYSESGLDLLKIGTPTNILSDEDLKSAGSGGAAKSSDYDTGRDAQVEDFFQKSIMPLPKGVQPAVENSDAARLTDLFCFNNLRTEENPFLNVTGRDQKDFLLWRNVREGFLKVLADSHPILKVIADSTRLRAYFLDNVSPIGVYAPFRIGSQPYGIVPVCDFKNLQYSKTDPLYTLKQILILLTEKWNAIVSTSVISEENMNVVDKMSTQQRYVKAVSATPISSSFYARSTIREQDVLTPSYFKGWKDGVDPIKDIFELIRSQVPELNQKEFINKYVPSFPELPLREAVFAEFEKDFTWKNIKVRIRSSLPQSALAGLNDLEVDDLITATFDMFNYRLDTWLTGLLDERLRQRKGKTHRIALGAYGWVFNLHEDAAEPVTDEFIIAPSINQAITAAVLRSSFNRAADGDKKDYSLGINLSSTRVRQALSIIHGIKNGLSLGAILGSELERAIHNDYKDHYELESFIYYLRMAYPLNDTSTTYGEGRKDGSIDVLNGVALLEDLQNRSKHIKGVERLQLTDIFIKDSDLLKDWLKKLFQTDQYRQLISGDFDSKIYRLVYLIQHMQDAYDALSDVITAETVYKLTEGNLAAVEALMNSMNTGRNFPEPDVTEIPVSSAHVEQRVFVALDPGCVVDAQSCDSFFRIGEPALDDWMGEMLGFKNIQYIGENGGKEVHRWLDEKGLGLSPSELVYLSGDWDRFEDFLRWMDFLNTRQKGEAEPIRLDDAKFAVDAMRELLSHSFPLKQEDLTPTAVKADERNLLHEMLATRYQGMVQKVIGLRNQLERLAETMERSFAAAPSVPLSEDQLRQAILLFLKCFRAGVNDALSGIDRSLFLLDDDRYDHPVEFAETLSRQQSLPKRLRNLAQLLEERLLEAEPFERKSYADAMKKILGHGFIAVLPFKLENNGTIDEEAIIEQLGPQDYFRNADRMVLEDTLVDLADVRNTLAALHQLRLYGKFNYLPAARNVRPMQLGYKARTDADKHYWMGAEVGEERVGDANVYTVLNPSAFVVDKGKQIWRVAGLVLDYWVDKIPYREQTAGVAFGYDQPDAESPQAILVGVSTIGSNHRWSEHRMLRTIRSAMYQVKSRAVEPEHVYADKWTSGLFPLISIDPAKL